MQYLPQDILYEIFKIVAEDSPILGPLITSHCCQHWRKAALAASTLWTIIRVESSKPQYVDRLAAWLERSCECGLDITIQASSAPYDEFGLYVDQCIGILVSHSNRWKVLRIRVPTLSAESSRLIFDCHLPELKELSLTISKIVQSSQLNPLGAKAPRLQDLILNGSIPMSKVAVENSGLLSPTLKKFTILHNYWNLTSTSLEICLAVLRKCPLLEELVVNLMWTLAAQESATPSLFCPLSEEIIVMPNLKRLDIGTSINRRKAPVLLRIQAPILTKLGSPIHVDYIPQILSLSTFPFPHLQYLGLQAPIGAAVLLLSDNLATFLCQLPDLRHLVLRTFPFVGPVSDTYPFLIVLGTSCLKLHSLELDSCLGDRMAVDIRRLIRARKRHESDGVQQIKYLKISRLPNPFLLSDDDIKWLKGRVEEVVIESGGSGV